MRSKNAIKNLIIYLIYEVFVFALGIIFPRYIILQYGSEINGLTSTITRLLSLINLIQAGAVGAAIYQMYKPIAENDYETQSAIIYSSRKFYNKITIIYLVLAVCVGLFYSFYLENDSLKFYEILFSFAILATNGSFTLYFNSICDIYLSPHQKKYYLTISSIIGQIINYSLLTFVLVLKLHFIFIYISILLGGICCCLLNVIFYKRISKNKIEKKPVNTKYKIPDKKYLMLSCIGGEAVTASPTIIITTFIGLAYSSVFSIYALIFTSMKTLLNSIQLSFSAIFGNLVKTSDDEHIYRVFNLVELITFIVGIILSTCVGFLILPFINIYTRGFIGFNYYYPILALFVVIYTALFTFRTSFGYVATVYGIFKYTCKITLIFGGIGIVTSTISAIIFGMPYVMVGLLTNQLGCAIATLIMLKKKIPWFKTNNLFKRTIILVLFSSIGFITYFAIKPLIDTWLKWIIYGIILVVFVGILLLIYCVIFERKEIKYLFAYIKQLFNSKKQIKKGEN